MSDRPGSSPLPDDGLGLPHYVPGSTIGLVDAERWPPVGDGSDAEAARRRDGLERHPAAPRWVHRTGHRLDRELILEARSPLRPDPGWLDRHLAAARALPAYRGHPGPLARLEDFPTIRRDDLARDVTSFVPDDADLSRLVQGSSSGSTGAALVLPDDVVDVARAFWLIEETLGGLGIDWRPDARRAALFAVVRQRQAFTYVSTAPGFGTSPVARVNLGEPGWTTAREFLAAADPQVISGSPASLAGLLRDGIPAAIRPLALVSGAAHLEPALRAELSAALGCPVVEYYGLHETRPIAWRVDDGPILLLDRRVIVEVLSASEPVPPGERGELVVTAGSNPLLPLVRYRTGDFGRLVEVDGRAAIVDLEGREDVRFRGPAGAEVPAVDLTQQLQDAGLAAWSIVQRADGSVDAAVVGGDAQEAARRLTALLGLGGLSAPGGPHDAGAGGQSRLRMRSLADPIELGEGKPRRYRVER